MTFFNASGMVKAITMMADMIRQKCMFAKHIHDNIQ